MFQKRSQIRFWSAYARVYDGLLELRPYADLITDATGELDLAQEAVVVDLGCGTGNCITEVMEANGSTVSAVIGVDSSPQMLSIARRKLGHLSEVELVESSILDWMESRPTGSVDNVVSVNVLYTMGADDRKLFWNGLARILTDRGNAVVVTTDRAGFGPVAKEHLSRVPVWRAFSFRLLTVLIMNMMIWLFESTDEYDPVELDVLVEEARSAGLNVSSTKRCYGGEINGIDVMIVIENERIDLSSTDGGSVEIDLRSGDRVGAEFSPGSK